MGNLFPDDLSSLSDDELAELNRRSEFVRDAMPGDWLEVGIEMRDAAEALWPLRSQGLRVWGYTRPTGETIVVKVSTISRPYILLAGFALENLMKGWMVFEDPALINTGRLHRRLKSHKLTTLVRHTSVRPSADEQWVIQIMEDAIPSWGRYPVPLDSSRLTEEVALDERIRAGFTSLFEKLREPLDRKLEGGWDSLVGAKQYPRIKPKEADE